MGVPFTVVDRVEVNDEMKIVDLSAHFNFKAVKGKEPDEAGDLRDWAEKYGNALLKHGNGQLTGMFAKKGEVSWEDPVGGKMYKGLDKIKSRAEDMPPMKSVEVREVFFTMSPKIFMVKVAVTFKDAEKPIFILDRVEIA